MSAPAPVSQPSVWRDELARFGNWCRANPLQLALWAAILGVAVYFFGFYKIYTNGSLTAWQWAREAWNEANDLEHGGLVLPGAIVVAWLHRDQFRTVTKRPAASGLLLIAFGIALFLAAAWTLQPRIALLSMPVLILGSVAFVWGWKSARIALFPCALLLFMLPVGFLLGHTEPLQRLVAVTVSGMTNLLQLGIARDGVKLFATDGSFQCEVAGGCSGIRSLMAMTMLSALYVHFTQKTLWKKLLIFCTALPFAVIGNIVRVFTIVLVARFISPGIGTGPWHDISGFIVTIPIALTLMVRMGDLLNRDWSKTLAPVLEPEAAAVATAGETRRPGGPISYDY
jgi:exosortase